jgi:Protein of unknown function (DUF3311)
MTPLSNDEPHRPFNRAWFLLLLLPYACLLWVPFYAKAKPALWGFPLFYWYQFLWVPLSALLTGWVYRVTR